MQQGNSFAGMTLDKCIILQIRTLTGCPLCKESHSLGRLKNPTEIQVWLFVGFHPATRSVQSTPADNTRERVWQHIEKERKKHDHVLKKLTFDLLTGSGAWGVCGQYICYHVAAFRDSI